MTKRLWILTLLCYALTCCSGVVHEPGRPPLIILVGGWGESQLGDITATLHGQEMIQTGYRSPLPPLAGQRHVILVGHSWGCDRILNDAPRIPHVDEIILLDPVATDWSPALPPPPAGVRVLEFRRADWLGPPVALIPGVVPVIITGGHNSVPHAPQVLGIIRQEVQP